MSMTAPGNPELEGPVSSRCHLTASIIICVSLLLATGCGKGGDGGTETPILAPNGLSYTVPGPLLIGISITPLAPSYGGGAVSSWTCEPDLPEGLTFDSSDGVISGTPVELSPPTEYQITASNGSGSSTFFSSSPSSSSLPVRSDMQIQIRSTSWGSAFFRTSLFTAAEHRPPGRWIRHCLWGSPSMEERV